MTIEQSRRDGEAAAGSLAEAERALAAAESGRANAAVQRDQAESALAAARAALSAARAEREALARALDHGGGAALDELIPPARLAIVHAMQAAVDVTTLLFQAGGTRAVFNRHGLERRFRDAQVAAQHVAGSPTHYEAAGRLALGLPAAAPFW